MKQIILVTAICCFFVAICHAQYHPNNYLELEVGRFFPSGSIDTYEGNYKFQPVNEIGLKYTHYINDNVGAIIRIFNVNLKSEEKSNTYGSRYYAFYIVGLNLGLALRYPVSNLFDFVANGGFVEFLNSINTVGDGGNYYTGVGLSNGYFADVGLRFKLSDRFILGALFRYTYNEQNRAYYAASGSAEHAGDEKITIDFSGMSALLSVGLSF